MSKIFPTNETDPIERLQREPKKISDTPFTPTSSGTGRRERSSAPETTHLDLLSAQHRLQLRNEFTLRALENAGSLVDRTLSPAQKDEGLSSLIREIRFQEHPVLAEYEGRLREIIQKSDQKAYDALLTQARTSLSPNAETEIVRENLAALSSRNPEGMLKDIVREMKTNGLPAHAVARQRVLDLLR
ncbi:MAG TPA: hypothetical protein ENN69_08865 [Spirochaetia bacterium]|nr:hypothetical protein [Spirochaetia bacterium]